MQVGTNCLGTFLALAKIFFAVCRDRYFNVDPRLCHEAPTETCASHSEWIFVLSNFHFSFLVIYDSTACSPLHLLRRSSFLNDFTFVRVSPLSPRSAAASEALVFFCVRTKNKTSGLWTLAEIMNDYV